MDHPHKSEYHVSLGIRTRLWRIGTGQIFEESIETARYSMDQRTKQPYSRSLMLGKR